MNTNAMKLNVNETELVTGGDISSYLTPLKLVCIDFVCNELGCHDYEWNGEWGEPFTLDGIRYRHKIAKCSRCGATKNSIGYYRLED